MGVRGPAPKNPALRQRRNQTTTRATLPTPEESALNEVPDLPERQGGWRSEVVTWWESAWRSPMASEWLDSDMHGGLYLLADLYQARWIAREDPKLLRELAAEIRTQCAEFGLTPMTRRRLQWEIEKGEQAAERTESRRKSSAPAKRAVRDPRRRSIKIA